MEAFSGKSYLFWCIHSGNYGEIFQSILSLHGEASVLIADRQDAIFIKGREALLKNSIKNLIKLQSPCQKVLIEAEIKMVNR